MMMALRAPKRSASAPVTGCARPQIRFCNAMAKANTSRPQPNSALIGGRNRPKPWRVPSDSARISDAPSSSQVVERHAVVIVISSRRPPAAVQAVKGPSGQLVEQLHQLATASFAQPSIQLTLHLFPQWQRLFNTLQAGFCEPYLASA